MHNQYCIQDRLLRLLFVAYSLTSAYLYPRFPSTQTQSNTLQLVPDKLSTLRRYILLVTLSAPELITSLFTRLNRTDTLCDYQDGVAGEYDPIDQRW